MSTEPNEPAKGAAEPTTKKPAANLTRRKTKQPATTTPAKSDRIGVIGAVNTPLGFFALIVLVVEALIGLTTVKSKLTEEHQFIMLWAMVGMLFLMIALVAAIAVWKPEVLSIELGESTLKKRQQEHQQQVENQKLMFEHTLKQIEIAQEEAKNAKEEFAETKDLIESDALRVVMAEIAESVYAQKALPPAPKSRRRKPSGEEPHSSQTKE